MSDTFVSGLGTGFSTQQVHAGDAIADAFGARVPPVYLSAGFVFDDFAQAQARFAGEDGGYSYTRVGNPTATHVENRLAELEGGAEAILVSSGQAAVTVALLALLGAGDHLVASRHLYPGSVELFQENFARLGIDVDFVDDPTDPEAWAQRITPRTRALFGESITNPTAEVLDVAALADIAHRHGIVLVVDNTLATPYLLRPIDYGADIVVHSASKFLAGHGTALGGVIVDAGERDWGDRYPHLVEPSRSLRGAGYAQRYGRRAYAQYARNVIAVRLGTTISPLNAFLIGQGVETLSLRIDRLSRTALEVARWLESHEEVAAVSYAGLHSSPSYARARSYLPRGSGSVFAFELGGGRDAAIAVYDSLRLFTRMTHIGDVRSLVLHPGTTTHALLSDDERSAAGVGPGVLRLSIGVEDPADLIGDLLQALTALASAVGARSASRG